MRLVEHSARINRSSISCWRDTGGSLRRFVGVRSVYSRCQNGKTSPAASPAAARWIMAQRLGRACSTINREVARHGGRAQYRANAADQQAWQTALRPKPCRLAMHAALREIVARKLMQNWSPKQISGWLKTEYPNDESLRVSHETIYRSLFIQARGA